MIKRVEVNYRGIFQKNLGKKIGSDIVMIASRMGQKASRRLGKDGSVEKGQGG